ncbi:MAG: TOBE domain-containing protein [Micropruina glycogenica]
MTKIRISDAARYLGVSDDTVRRWVDQGTLAARTRPEQSQGDRRPRAGRVRQDPGPPGTRPRVAGSARNRFVGLVTEVISDTVMSQVELQCGPFRVVSLLSTEAVRELGLEPGSVAVAVVKATNVIVETP